MIETSTDIQELSKALIAAQGELRAVAKDSANPHFKNRYASLEAVIDVAKPVLVSHGLAFTQAPGAIIEGAVEITTMLMHSSGQWMRSTLHMPLAKRDPQGVGSALTYGLRYSLMAVLGVPPTNDDDAERGMDRTTDAEAKKKAEEVEAKKKADKTLAETLKIALKMAKTGADLDQWGKDNAAAIDGLPNELKSEVYTTGRDHRASLKYAKVAA